MKVLYYFNRNKMLAGLFWFCFGVVSSVLFVAAEAMAVEEHMVTPDRYKSDDISLNQNEAITGFFHAGRSYECRISQAAITPGHNDYIYFSTTVMGPSSNVTATGVGSSYPAEAVLSTANAARQNLHRISFIPTETGVHTMSMVFDSGNFSDGSIGCTETTLSGGFNSFFAAVPIVELRNGGNTDLTATVTATDFDGNQIDQQTKLVPASSRGDVVLTVPANVFGTIRVTYIGSRGALSGIVAEYDFGPGSSITLKRERPLRATQIVQ